MDPPNSLSIQMVMAMFQRLEEKVDSIAAKGISEEAQEKINQEALRAVEYMAEPISQENAQLRMEVNICKHQNQVLTGIVDQLTNKIQDLHSKIEGLEISNAKRCVTLSNFETREKKNDKISDVRDFFWSMFQIDIGVDDVYEIGSQTPPTLVVVLQTQEDRRILMQNKKKLKNYENSKGQKCYINEFQPASVNVRKRREKDIIQQNEEKQENNRVSIEHSRGNLVIQGKPYKKLISTPSPFEMIDLNAARLTEIMSIKLNAGDEIHEQQSVFQAYTKNVSTPQQIRDAYMKMKLCFPTARHIVCAYALDYDNPLHSDYVDDDETGAGRIILEMMRRSGIKNRVIFLQQVLWYYEVKLK